MGSRLSCPDTLEAKGACGVDIIGLDEHPDQTGKVYRMLDV